MKTERFQFMNKKFNPKKLFRDWSQWVWYDPSDINRYMSNLWPELISNWTFDNTTGWTTILWTISAVWWRLRVARAVWNIWIAVAPITCEIWKTYFVSLDRYKVQTWSTQVTIAISSSTSAGSIYSNSWVVDWTFTFSFVATQTNHWIFLEAWSGTDWQYAEYDNVTIKEIVTNTIWPELISNWDFSSDWSGWIDASSSPAIVDFSGTWALLTSNWNTSRLRKSLATVIGKRYIVNITHWTVNAVARFSIWYTAWWTELLASTVTNTGVSSYTFVAWTTETWFSWFNSGSPNLQVLNLSVKELISMENITMFQDALWTIPVTWIEQPVGLILDKSRWLAMWPNLYNGWNITWVPIWWAAFNNYSLWFNVTAWKEYRVSIDVTNYSWTNTYSVWWVTWTDWVVLNPQTGNRKWEFTLFALSNTGFALFTRSTNTCNFSNISVREIYGNHAYQTTSTSRPTLKARYNLLEKTEQFNDSTVWSWVQNITITPNAWIAPDWTNSATLIAETTTNSSHYIAQNTNFATWLSYKISVAFKKWTGVTAPDWIQMTLPSWSFGWVQYCNFNIANWTIWNYTGWTPKIINLPNGWYRCEWTATSTSAWTYGTVWIILTNNNNWLGRWPWYAWLTTSDVFIWWPDLRISNDTLWMPEYQRVNNSTDYNTVWFPYYLSADWVDDWLQSNTINFSTTNKLTLITWLRINSVTWVQMPIEFSTSYATNLWAFELSLNEVIAWTFAFATKRTAATHYKFWNTAQWIRTLVFAWDIDGSIAPAATSITYRENWTNPAVAASWNETLSAFWNYPLFLFRRAATSASFNGRFYGLVLIGKKLNSSDFAKLERYINNKTKWYV